MVGLGDLVGGEFRSHALATDFDGSIVVGEGSTKNPREAFRWSTSTGMQGMGDLPGGFDFSTATGVRNGTIVGYSSSTDIAIEAFRWTESTGMVGLGVIPGGQGSSGASAVSADGQVIVGTSSSPNSGSEAFRWSADDGMVGIGDLPGGPFLSLAIETNRDGSAIVGIGYTEIGIEAFLWSASDGMQGLGDLPGGGVESIAEAVSGDGTIVVGHSLTGNTRQEAFFWTEADGMRLLQDVLVDDFDLDLLGFSRLSDATGISDDGNVIVGWGQGPRGREAWMVVIPAPSSMILLLGGAAMGVRPRRRPTPRINPLDRPAVRRQL